MADEQGQVDALRERAKQTGASDELIEYSDQLYLKSSDYSITRHRKLLGNLVRLQERHGNLPAALEDRGAAEGLVRFIHREFENEETNRDYRLALRSWGKHLGDSDEIPDCLAWISSTYSSDHDPTPEPRNMLRWGSDVQDMLAAAQNARDEAAIALAFDAGLRGSEFQAIEVGDITDHKHGLQVTVNGKRGQRTITLVPSVPYVTKWLGEHPRGDDPNAPLWCKLGTGESISYGMVGRMLSDPGERAGIEKPLTITNFRKSSAAHLASKGMNQPHLEDHHGWVRGSDAAARYVSVFGDDADRELARVYGREVEEPDDADIAPVECPRCGEETPREKSLCVWCGQALEPGAAARAEALEDLLVEQLAAADPDDAEDILEFREQINDDPEARARAVDRMLDSEST